MVQEAAEEVALDLNEVEIHLRPKSGPDWTIPGRQQEVLAPRRIGTRYPAESHHARTGPLTWVESEGKYCDLFIDQLWSLVKKDDSHARKIHLILGNYRIHRSQRTRLALDAVSEKVQLHISPPYSSDENRFERMWKDLHDHVTRNHTCRTLKHFMQKVRTCMRKPQQTGGNTYPKRHVT